MIIPVIIEPRVRSTGATLPVSESRYSGNESHPLELDLCACRNGRVNLVKEAHHCDPLSRDSPDAQSGDQPKEYRKHTAMLQKYRFKSPQKSTASFIITLMHKII
jgi:hypothetical protein